MPNQTSKITPTTALVQVPRPIYYIPQDIQRQLLNNMLQSLQNNSTPSTPHSLASDIEDLEPITQLSPKRAANPAYTKARLQAAEALLQSILNPTHSPTDNYPPIIIEEIIAEEPSIASTRFTKTNNDLTARTLEQETALATLKKIKAQLDQAKNTHNLNKISATLEALQKYQEAYQKAHLSCQKAKDALEAATLAHEYNRTAQATKKTATEEANIEAAEAEAIAAEPIHAKITEETTRAAIAAREIAEIAAIAAGSLACEAFKKISFAAEQAKFAVEQQKRLTASQAQVEIHKVIVLLLTKFNEPDFRDHLAFLAIFIKKIEKKSNEHGFAETKFNAQAMQSMERIKDFLQKLAPAEQKSICIAVMQLLQDPSDGNSFLQANSNMLAQKNSNLRQGLYAALAIFSLIVLITAIIAATGGAIGFIPAVLLEGTTAIALTATASTISTVAGAYFFKTGQDDTSNRAALSAELSQFQSATNNLAASPQNL